MYVCLYEICQSITQKYMNLFSQARSSRFLYVFNSEIMINIITLGCDLQLYNGIELIANNLWLYLPSPLPTIRGCSHYITHAVFSSQYKYVTDLHLWRTKTEKE